MKVEIFSSDYVSIYHQINNWFKENPDAEIFKILQSESGGKMHLNECIETGILTISIFYEKVDSKRLDNLFQKVRENI